MLMSTSLTERTGEGAVASDLPNSHVACDCWGHLCVIAVAAFALACARVVKTHSGIEERARFQGYAGASCNCWQGGNRTACNHRQHNKLTVSKAGREKQCAFWSWPRQLEPANSDPKKSKEQLAGQAMLMGCSVHSA
jgi:hypothetical protein